MDFGQMNNDIVNLCNKLEDFEARIIALAQIEDFPLIHALQKKLLTFKDRYREIQLLARKNTHQCRS